MRLQIHARLTPMDLALRYLKVVIPDLDFKTGGLHGAGTLDVVRDEGGVVGWQWH